jgi:hypothetical protein
MELDPENGFRETKNASAAFRGGTVSAKNALPPYGVFAASTAKNHPAYAEVLETP